MDALIRPDIAVTSQDGKAVLLVEVKRTQDALAYQAGLAQLRSYLLALQQTPYLLLLNPNRFWLWKSADEEPVYTGETPLLLVNYIDLQKVPLTQLNGQALTSVVYSWLGSVMFKPAATLLAMPAQKWLVESGLHERIYRGYIHQEGVLV